MNYISDHNKISLIVIIPCWRVRSVHRDLKWLGPHSKRQLFWTSYD